MIEMWEEIVEGTLAGNYTIEDIQELFSTTNEICEYNFENDANEAALSNAKKILQCYRDLPDGHIATVDQAAFDHFKYR